MIVILSLPKKFLLVLNFQKVKQWIIKNMMLQIKMMMSIKKC